MVPTLLDVMIPKNHSDECNPLSNNLASEYPNARNAMYKNRLVERIRQMPMYPDVCSQHPSD